MSDKTKRGVERQDGIERRGGPPRNPNIQPPPLPPNYQPAPPPQRPSPVRPEKRD